ncbi:hypothetical protein [Mycobacterium hubeiense]|uniref:hypothetical protein n=1 Tax=Mycobacterium hubeiense TaxID=1867256 RepID=UPI000C7ED720|nr:hypothetical protein [Mycobacterium sp. QGD 101]
MPERKVTAMHTVNRPYLTSAIAMVGASVVVAAPVATTKDRMGVASPAVQLSVDAAMLYQDVVDRAVDNTQELIALFLGGCPGLRGI